jgi:hypothetical protein
MVWASSCWIALENLRFKDLFEPQSDFSHGYERVGLFKALLGVLVALVWVPFETCCSM